MTAIVPYRIDSARHMHRYYRMDVQPDLFGQWCVIREWGRTGSTGQTRCVPFPALHQAQAAIEQQRRVKLRRGYRTYAE
jgi:predicted DNA-binding WGR domain protein